MSLTTEVRVVGLLTFFFVSIHWVVCLGGRMCHDAAVPAFTPKGANRIHENSTEPLVELKVKPRKDFEVSGAYEVLIVTKNKTHSFTDATVSISNDGTCEKGELQFNPTDFFQVQQDASCPKVLSTNRKTSMFSLPSLVWTPSLCGCVQFRAVLVLAGGKNYLAESNDVATGPLAKRLCVTQEKIQVTREQRLEALCHVSDKHTTPGIISSEAFRQRHQLDIHLTDQLEVEMALELRRADARMCCAKPNKTEKLKCFEHARYRRVDRFCQDGFPDIPFLAFRTSFMRTKERRCCSILGTYRYLCFSKGSQMAPGKDGTAMDFSLDATDPANDFAEFGTMKDFRDLLDRLQNLSKSKMEILQAKHIVEGDDDKPKYKINKQNIKHKGVKMNYFQETTKTYTKVSQMNGQSFNTPKTHSKDSESVPDLPAKTTISPIQSTPSIRQTTEEQLRLPLKRQVLRRLPEDVKPKRLLPASSERRKYRRKNGGGSAAKGSLRLSSGERRKRGKSNKDRRYHKKSSKNIGLSREAWRDYRRFTSSERRLRGRSRTGGKEPSGVMEDFDDQGGQSAEDTLNYLERKMKRLELRQICCQAGAIFGKEMSESLSVVLDECKHSSYKFLQSEKISFGVKKCGHQFIKCCVGEATIGLTMSSSEFRDKAYFAYLDNVHRTDPVIDDDGVMTRSSMARKRGKARSGLRGVKVKGAGSMEDTLEAESDRRFESMRAEADDHRFDREKDFDDADEYTGPRLFDDEDNKNVLDITDDDVMGKRKVADRKVSTISQLSKKSNNEGDDGVLDDDDDDYDGDDDDDDDDSSDQGGKDNSAVNEEDYVDEKKGKSEGSINVPEHGMKKDRVDVTPSEIASKNVDLLKTDRKKDDERGKYFKYGRATANRVRNRSRGRSSERPRMSAARNNDLDDSFRRSRLRSSSRPRSSSRSRSTSRSWDGGSSRRRSIDKSMRRNRRPYRSDEKKNERRRRMRRKKIAMDSREMAAENQKLRTAALDSKELADKYNERGGALTPIHKYERIYRQGGSSRKRKRYRKKGYQ